LDVTPIEQYEGGEAPIIPINYSEQCKYTNRHLIFLFVDTEVMGYFRALYTKMEISERALSLTKETIILNQGNYTAWYYRRKLLFELGKDLGEELRWLNLVGLEMQKNY
jgi:protein farnesyltransferase/geranylgeranyltransferase type-1 subunit alpha